MNPEERFRELCALHLPDVVDVDSLDPRELVPSVVRLCEEATDEDEMAGIAESVIDPLLDRHWDAVAPTFEAAMAASAPLRRCWSFSLADIPEVDFDRLDDLLRPGEDLGRQPDASFEKPKGCGSGTGL